MKHPLFFLLIALLAAPMNATALDSAMISQFEQQLATVICADQGQWLKCYQMEPSQCQKVAHGIVGPCVTSILGRVTGQVNEPQGLETAQELQNCFNKRFNSSYAALKVETPECQEPLKHLQPN